MVLLPLAAWAALALAMHHVAARIFHREDRAIDRVCTTAVLTPAAIALMVRLLGIAHALYPFAIWIATVGIAAIPWWLGRHVTTPVVRADLTRAKRTILAATRGCHVVPALTGVIAIALAAWASALLAPWSWDGLGYHLPVVYDALQEHRLRTVPTSVVFVNAYPHAAEWMFIAWRAWLPDDTWIEFAQAPFGVLVVVAIAAIATRAGASGGRSLALAVVYLALPAVMLQLASNYVDLLYAALVLLAAYFASGVVDSATFVMTCAALALLLAVKPSAPPAVVIVLACLAYRARRARPSRTALVLSLAVLLLGAETYLVHIVRHRNPVWPVAMHIGPFTLPGLAEARGYLEAGLPEEYARRGWLSRLLHSWFQMRTRYVYDMRVGGLAPLFPFALLPLALLGSLRVKARRAIGPVALAALAGVASPAAFWPRYTFAVPAAALVMVIVATEGESKWQQRALATVVTALAAWGIVIGVNGFTDAGPSLLAMTRMSHEQRVAEVSVDGDGLRWHRALATLHRGDAAAYAGEFELSGLLWRGDGANRVLYLDHAIDTLDALHHWVDAERVRLAVLDDHGSGALAAGDPRRFEALFHCRYEACTVYRVHADVTRRRLLVIAPHPDDEVLIAAGVIGDAVHRNVPVDVVVLTNGDYTCARDGYAREGETVAALARLGLDERHLHFLGYPDGALARLSHTPLEPMERRNEAGACVRGNETYAARGASRRDEHTARTGSPALYTSDAIVDDLLAILARTMPSDIYVTHAIDDHPDHASAYMYLRRAFEREPRFANATVHRAIVHAGPCWPDGSGRREPCPVVTPQPRAEMPPLPTPLEDYVPRERVPIHLEHVLGAGPFGAKFDAMALYRSQTGPNPETDWLASFTRSDEVFFPERLVPDRRAPRRLVRSASYGAPTNGNVAWRGGWSPEGSRDVTMTAPFECRVDSNGAAQGSEWSIDFTAHGDGLRFALHDGTEFVVTRIVRGDLSWRLRRMPLPNDDGPNPHRFEFRFDRRDDEAGAIEITFRRDGEFLTSAVDPHGPEVVDRIAMHGAGGVTVSRAECIGVASATY
jgi:LmbE family N-acetylglucosaminyl deacetylase